MKYVAEVWMNSEGVSLARVVLVDLRSHMRYHARDEIRSMAQDGVWADSVYYPPDRIVGIKLLEVKNHDE